MHWDFHEIMAQLSKKWFLLGLRVNLPSLSFPEGELLAHHTVKNQDVGGEKSRRVVGGRDRIPSREDFLSSV